MSESHHAEVSANHVTYTIEDIRIAYQAGAGDAEVAIKQFGALPVDLISTLADAYCKRVHSLAAGTRL